MAINRTWTVQRPHRQYHPYDQEQRPVPSSRPDVKNTNDDAITAVDSTGNRETNERARPFLLLLEAGGRIEMGTLEMVPTLQVSCATVVCRPRNAPSWYPY